MSPISADDFTSDASKRGFEPQVVVEVEQAEVLLAFVAAGVGVSCVPALVRRLGFAGIAGISLEPSMGGVSVIWNPETLPAAGHHS